MHKLVYKISNGTVVSTYEEALQAKEKGYTFRAVMTKVIPEKRKATPVRQMMLDTYGVVRPRKVGA
jgi:hypothetical protein